MSERIDPDIELITDDASWKLKLSEALRLAEEQGLDCILVSPKATPPIYKLMDWGKWSCSFCGMGGLGQQNPAGDVSICVDCLELVRDVLAEDLARGRSDGD